MKEHIIRAILYEDMSVKWKDSAQNGDGTVHLNVHQKTRQFVEVELGDFLLSDGEGILISFEKVEDGDIYHINPAHMEKIEDESRAFRAQIPPLVHNTPGVWVAQFFIVTDYDPITSEYTNAYPSDKIKFSEYSSLFDDGLSVPTADNMKELYKAIKQAADEAQKTNVPANSYSQEIKEEGLEIKPNEVWFCKGKELHLLVGKDNDGDGVVGDGELIDQGEASKQIMIVTSKATTESGYMNVFYFIEKSKTIMSLMLDDGTSEDLQDTYVNSGVCGGCRMVVKEFGANDNGTPYQACFMKISTEGF